MCILPDHEIRWLCEREQMIVPFDPQQLNPASYDLLLGSHLMIESAAKGAADQVLLDISDNTKENPYWLKPGQFVLAETFETFNMPDDIAGQFVLKSSRAREGLQHLLAGYCDPGWNGSKLTLELKNIRQLKALPVWPGMRIGQIVFFLTAGKPEVSYAQSGHYNGHQRVMPSWEAA
jgi:dCTP deaminase